MYGENGRPLALGDMMTLMVSPSSKDGGITAGKFVNVVWSKHDREMGRPLLDLKAGSQLRVYAYVVPRGLKSRIKSREDIVLNPAPAVTILLVRADPL